MGSVRVRRNSYNFNPRSREGSDIDTDVDLRFILKFQSTLPRGERLRLSNVRLVE